MMLLLHGGDEPAIIQIITSNSTTPQTLLQRAADVLALATLQSKENYPGHKGRKNYVPPTSWLIYSLDGGGSYAD